MATQNRPLLVDDPGIWFGIATGLVVLTYLVAGLAGLGASATAVAAIVVGGLAACRLPGLVALGLGIVVWAFYTGFTENDYGQLTFADGDVVRLVVFTLATVLLGRAVSRSVQRDGLQGGLHDRGIRHG